EILLDPLHRVGRPGAADEGELVAARVVEGRLHADALVVVVVPDDVDLRRGADASPGDGGTPVGGRSAGRSAARPTCQDRVDRWVSSAL
ncbi:MAG: hypothetical protein AVDCRST_MAG48-3034, partial [uncultured Friedmanniella sp.]